jgi:hypothetical protein
MLSGILLVVHLQVLGKIIVNSSSIFFGVTSPFYMVTIAVLTHSLAFTSEDLLGIQKKDCPST